MEDVGAFVSRINVVYLYVRDLDRSIAFYRDLLGIPLERDPRNTAWAEARFADGVRFALHETAPEDVRGSGSTRIDLEVADLDRAVERLRSAGVPVGRIVRDFWGAVCELTDPDGYRIDLFEPAKL